MDGVFQRNGVPVKMAYGGRLEIEQGIPKRFKDLIGYRGTTIDPLELFISSGLTSISRTHDLNQVSHWQMCGKSLFSKNKG